MRMKTTEEFKQDVFEKWGDKVTVLGEYTGEKNNIRIKCNVCGEEFEVTPNNYMRYWTCYCKKCGKVKHTSSQKKTTDYYKEEIKEKWKGVISVIGEYSGDGVEILHHCNNCNTDIMASPKNMLRRKYPCSCMVPPSCFDTHTTEEFKTKIKELYGDKYDCSKVEYINTSNLTEVICLEHGPFKASYDSLINKRNGCPKCAVEERRQFEEKVKQARELWNGIYEYPDQPYKNIKTPIDILCHKHGIFKKSFTEHISLHQGCPECLKEYYLELRKKNFIENATRIHDGKYNYDNIDYVDSQTPVYITCSIHGDFYMTPQSHLKGAGCPDCFDKSGGEKKIAKWLDEHNINYIYNQSCLDWFIYIRKMKPDFYLPDYNMIIEYDGQQHFEPIEYFGGEEAFKYTQKRDAHKEFLCEEHNVKLLRIPYTDFEDIELILDKELS